MTGPAHGRLVAVDLDPDSLRPAGSFIDAERSVAIHDLLLDNDFTPKGSGPGDYRLAIAFADGKLRLDIATADGAPVARHFLALTAFRRVVKDYFLLCEAWYAAHGTGLGHVEAVDVGRRSLHNEGATLVQQRLAGRISVDFDTARRLFTLITALHWKG